MKNNKLKIGITIGDPNGIGIEVILKTFQNKEMLDFFTPVIFGLTKLITYQKNEFKLNSMHFQGIFKPEEAVHGKINVVNLWKDNVNVEFGKTTEEGLKIAKASLTSAVDALENGSIDVLVTSPVENEVFKVDDFDFKDQVDFLEKRFKSKSLVIVSSEELKVAMATYDIPFAEAASSISKELIRQQVKILNDTLVQDYCIDKPKIAVLALNSNDGDKDNIGKEEVEIINPVISQSFNRGILTFGSYTSESFFIPSTYSAFDSVLAMYYDQGMIPFKTLNYENGVNFIAGLPYVITSPNHGTAYDIAGKGVAEHAAFEQAVFDAVKIYKTRKEYLELKENALQKAKIDGIDSLVDEDLPEDNIEL